MPKYNRRQEGDKIREQIQNQIVKKNGGSDNPNFRDAIEFDMAVDEIMAQLSEHPDIPMSLITEVMDRINQGRENVLMAMIGKRSTTQ